MATFVKMLIGVVMLVLGLCALLPMVSAEIPMKTAFAVASYPDPIPYLAQKWFKYADFLQTAKSSEYIGFVLAGFGLTVAGVLTLIKGK